MTDVEQVMPEPLSESELKHFEAEMERLSTDPNWFGTARRGKRLAAVLKAMLAAGWLVKANPPR